MQIAYNITMGIALVVGVIFSLLVFFTGKGDAMSGGSGTVRTTFKGKSSFDDQMAKITLILGASFMGLMIVIDIIGQYANKAR